MDPFRAINQMTKDGMKQTRKLSEEQVYSKMYYEDEVKPKFEAECDRLGLDSGVKSERMAVWRKLMKEAWNVSAQDEERQCQILKENA